MLVIRLIDELNRSRINAIIKAKFCNSQSGNSAMILNIKYMDHKVSKLTAWNKINFAKRPDLFSEKYKKI